MTKERQKNPFDYISKNDITLHTLIKSVRPQVYILDLYIQNINELSYLHTNLEMVVRLEKCPRCLVSFKV